jgi:hypothetical protein
LDYWLHNYLCHALTEGFMDAIDLDQQFVVATLPSKRFPVYTRANVAENWPGPVTTLSYTSMGGPLLEKSWRDALVRFGAFDTDEFGPVPTRTSWTPPSSAPRPKGYRGTSRTPGTRARSIRHGS